MNKQRYIICFFLLLGGGLLAQTKTGTALLDELLTEKQYEKAKIELEQQVSQLWEKKDYEALSGYPYYVGKITLETSNSEQALVQLEKFNRAFLAKCSNPEYLQHIYAETGSFYQSLGRHEEEIIQHRKALDYALSIPGKPGARVGTGYYNVATADLRLGNVANAIKGYRKALAHYQRDPNTDNVEFYFGYSSMGTTMYYSSKIDSAIYFYQKAIDHVSKSTDSPLNAYYRPALLLNNIAGLYSLQGETTKSLEAMKTSIDYNAKFLQSDAEDFKKNDALVSRHQYIDNLAGIYEKLGDYKKALQLLEFSYKGKKQHFEADSPELFKSKVLLGNAHLNLLNYEKAIAYLSSALKAIEQSNGTYYDWVANAQFGMARSYEERSETKKANYFYEQAAANFTRAFAEYFDPIVLSYFQSASQFYAHNNQPGKALETAEKAYKYVVQHQGEHTLPAFQQTVNMAEIYMEIGDYRNALAFSEKALDAFQNNSLKREYAIDSLQVAFYKPAALLVKAKAQLQLQPSPDIEFLTHLLNDIEDAIATVERRKEFVTATESVRALLEENNELYDFAKHINIALYQRTQNPAYVTEVMKLHETALYNRIRARLGSRNEGLSTTIPSDITARETSLRDKLGAAWKTNDIRALMRAEESWNEFLDSLSHSHPKYYEMRYARIAPSLAEEAIAPSGGATVVRYLYVNKNLYALVLTGTGKNLVELPAAALPNHLNAIAQPHLHVDNISPHLAQLYNILWKPIEPYINTKRVVIIPDGPLFNLSFETLTPQPIAHFSELATNSLLARHTISYNFSALLVNPPKPSEPYSENFIAFAPEFSEKMKQDYLKQSTDSLALDASYLTLLPQPFSVALVKKYARYFNGKSFIAEAASKKQFGASAKAHNIIHIGTHAESNNLSPALSRLIFAKDNTAENPEDNFLYTFEIYDQDLRSQLAILTACETGKPSYQPGEGMISLAHAFTYAGSESILTSLWKIDEQSSAQILTLFYDNIADGIPRDEALRQAKLSYLSTAKGRTLAPLYWGGLILMGDPNPLVLDTTNYSWYWIGAVALIVLVLLFFIWRARREPN
jgi:CHAT domain-containing protein